MAEIPGTMADKKILSRCCEIYENMEIKFLKNAKMWYTCLKVIK